MLTVNDLKSISAFGGGLDMSATRYSVEDLKSIAAFGKSKGASLVLRDVERFSAEELKSIAAFGGSRVTFVL